MSTRPPAGLLGDPQPLDHFAQWRPTPSDRAEHERAIARQVIAADLGQRHTDRRAIGHPRSSHQSGQGDVVEIHDAIVKTKSQTVKFWY